MTESKKPTESGAADERTALIVLSAETIDERQAFFDALDSFGFVRGPVVGGICAVTGPRDQIVALCDHASVMDLDAAVPGASEQLLALMRPVVSEIVFDDPVQTFNEQSQDNLGENGDRNDTNHDEPDAGMD